MGSLLTAMFVIVVAVLPAYADSDGYYCVGPGYLAVESRSFSTPSISGPHVLKILHFDEELGPRWTGEVVAEDFQTHVPNMLFRLILRMETPLRQRVPSSSGDPCVP